MGTSSLSGDVEAVCVPQTTAGKPDLYYGADFFNSFYYAVHDFLLVSFLHLVFAHNTCKSIPEGAIVNSPYQQVRGMGSRCMQAIQYNIISTFVNLLIALIGNIRLLLAWLTAPLVVCYHAGNFVLSLFSVRGSRAIILSFASQGSHLTGNDD